MLVWIASRSIAVIALITFAWCYLMAAVIYAAVTWAAQRGHETVLKASSPVTLTPLAVIFGLFIGFLAADVWPSFERARAAVGQEAMGLRQALIVADALPPEARRLVRAAVREHIITAVGEEWPAMAAGAETLRSYPRAMAKAVTELLSMNPAHSGQQLAIEHAVQAMERALDARRQRILISQASVGAVRWFVLMVLAGLIQITIAMVHAGSRRTP